MQLKLDDVFNAETQQNWPEAFKHYINATPCYVMLCYIINITEIKSSLVHMNNNTCVYTRMLMGNFLYIAHLFDKPMR